MLKEMLMITLFLSSFSSLLMVVKKSRCQMEMSQKYAVWSSQVIWKPAGASRLWNCDDSSYVFNYHSKSLNIVSSQKTTFFQEITE